MMQARKNSREQKRRYYSKRRCFSSLNIFKPNEMRYDDAVPSASRSQPELRGRSTECDRELCGRSTECDRELRGRSIECERELLGRSIDEDSISSKASSTKCFKTSIPVVRETNTSKLRKVFASMERLPKREQSMKYNQDKPRWNVPSRIRYDNKDGSIAGTHAAKMKKNEQSDGSESSFMKSKSDIDYKDCKFEGQTKSDIKLVPHICHHGSYMEVKFPSLNQSTSKLLKNENFDLQFVISASDLCEYAEKLKEQSKLILNNRKEVMLTPMINSDDLQVSGDTQCPFMKENYSNEQFRNWEKTKTSYVGLGTNKNMYSFDSGLEFIPYGTGTDTEENPSDSSLSSFPDTPSFRHQVNHLDREQHFEPTELRSSLGPSYQMSAFEKFTSVDQFGVPSSESKLLQNGVTITSRRYTKHEHAVTESKSVTKIPQLIGSVSVRKSVPAKSRSAFTLKQTFNPQDSLSNIPQYQDELRNEIPKCSLNEQMDLESKSPIGENEETPEDNGIRGEVSHSGNSPPFLKESKSEVPQEKRDLFADHNSISNLHSQSCIDFQEILPTEIQQNHDYQQLAHCLQEIEQQLNTENNWNSRTFENHTEIFKDVQEVCAQKVIPKSILKQQPIVKPAVPQCSQEVKCVTFREGIVQNISNKLQEQANCVPDILPFIVILVIVFISVFLLVFLFDE